MALCALYETLGWRARQVHFRPPEHFATEVFDGNQWILVDVDLDCTVRDATGRLLDADAVSRALVENRREDLQVAPLSGKRYPRAHAQFLWGFYGWYSWSLDRSGEGEPCSAGYLDQLTKPTVVRRRTGRMADGVIRMTWVNDGART